MTTISNTIAILPDYVFSSPRYHTVKQFITTWRDEDYVFYDSTNGAYDKFWGVYGLTDTEVPKLEMVLPDNTQVEITGDLGIFLFKERYTSMRWGKLNYSFPAPVTNTNLDKKEIFFTSYLYTKLNPGWSTFQILSAPDNPTQFSGFYVRAIGTSDSVRAYHAVKLEKDETGTSTVSFPTGIIVEYEGKLYKAKTATTEYPEGSDAWINIDSITNVFNADLFSITPSGYTKYIMEVSDNSRRFDPKTEIGVGENTSLVCWNVSYYGP